jgi:hypothetical protein
MNDMKRYWSFILLLCLSFSVIAQKKIDRVYDFPVRPGTTDWSNLSTEEERFNSLQIPDYLLKNMSTENLIITCINYPAFGHYTAFNSPQYGMDHLIKNFNGLQELLRRDDVPARLLSVYTEINSTAMNTKEISFDFEDIRSCFFELILAQKEVIDKMTQEEQITLIQEAAKRLKNKIDGKEETSFFTFQSTLLIVSRVLDKYGYAKFQKMKVENADIGLFVKTGNITNLSLINDLVEITDAFIKNK